jgi:hypothetical protein
VNEGENFAPRGQISPLGARGEVQNGPLAIKKQVLGGFLRRFWIMAPFKNIKLGQDLEEWIPRAPVCHFGDVGSNLGLAKFLQ